MTQLKLLIKNLGPGLLFAGMAIGTSHLVLSTKAGAQYGWIMVIPIILANIFKYPFFEFGVRYTNITNTSLIEGRQGLLVVLRLNHFRFHVYHSRCFIHSYGRTFHQSI